MITFILGFLIGCIGMFLFCVRSTKEVSSQAIAEILEECVEKIELHEWNTEKTVDFLSKTSKKIKSKE
ncbi:hypothetical protein [Lactococcus taiwanensis]|uniref:hypothetical protein n=1 Tax=Lactococcus taiwanensis TaxID=1151742 RepID=UPI003510FD20